MERLASLLTTDMVLCRGCIKPPKLFNEFLQDLRKFLNPKYGLKIGDLYLAYLLFAVLFSELAENLQAQIELF